MPRAIATDVAAAPLEGARALVAQLALPSPGGLRLGDGLAPLEPGEVATVAIAGMGGARILRILDAHPAVVAATRRLVLQPNTDVPAVRAWARDRGHALIDERMLLEKGRWYTILAIEPGAGAADAASWTPWDLQWGPVLRARRDPELRRFLAAELPRVDRALVEAQRAASPDGAAALTAQLHAIEDELARLAMAPGGLHGAGAHRSAEPGCGRTATSRCLRRPARPG